MVEQDTLAAADARWDPAIAALAQEVYEQKGRPLQVADFCELAREYAIRLDDVMATVFELCIHGHWRYQDAHRQDSPIDRGVLEQVTARGRLSEESLRDFTGGWWPVTSA